MLRRIGICSLTLFLLGLAVPSRADLVISLQDTNVNQGGYGVLNVWLGSTTPATDVFNNESFRLQVSGPNFLEFAPNPRRAVFRNSSNPELRLPRRDELHLSR